MDGGWRPSASRPSATESGLTADFRYGDIAGADFPRLAWRKVVTAALLRGQPRLRYGDPSGSLRLRTALQGYLWRARGLRCVPDQIVIVNGSQQGIDLCARLLLEPGDRAVMENPGYTLARQVFPRQAPRSSRSPSMRRACGRSDCLGLGWPTRPHPTSSRSGASCRRRVGGIC